MGFAQASPTSVYEDNTACIEWGNNVIGGRERAKRTDIRKRFAHGVIQNGRTKLIRIATFQPLADISTKPLHLWQASVAGILGNKAATTTKGIFVLKRGCCRQGHQVESRRPLRGVCRRLEER